MRTIATVTTATAAAICPGRITEPPIHVIGTARERDGERDHDAGDGFSLGRRELRDNLSVGHATLANGTRRVGLFLETADGLRVEIGDFHEIRRLAFRAASADELRVLGGDLGDRTEGGFKLL